MTEGTVGKGAKWEDGAGKGGEMRAGVGAQRDVVILGKGRRAAAARTRDEEGGAPRSRPLIFSCFTDICHMAKAVKTIRAKRSVESKHYIGRTAEGLLIPRPDFKPVSFTVRELQAAIRAVRREREAAAKVG